MSGNCLWLYWTIVDVFSKSSFRKYPWIIQVITLAAAKFARYLLFRYLGDLQNQTVFKEFYNLIFKSINQMYKDIFDMNFKKYPQLLAHLYCFYNYFSVFHTSQLITKKSVLWTNLPLYFLVLGSAKVWYYFTIKYCWDKVYHTRTKSASFFVGWDFYWSLINLLVL